MTLTPELYFNVIAPLGLALLGVIAGALTIYLGNLEERSIERQAERERLAQGQVVPSPNERGR
jgi:hypothetical protein